MGCIPKGEREWEQRAAAKEEGNRTERDVCMESINLGLIHLLFSHLKYALSSFASLPPQTLLGP